MIDVSFPCSSSAIVIENEEASWPCYECSENFQSSADLQKHLVEHDDEQAPLEQASHTSNDEDVKSPKRSSRRIRRSRVRRPGKRSGAMQTKQEQEVRHLIYSERYEITSKKGYCSRHLYFLC